MLSSAMAIAVFPHLIPAATIPNGELERALSEPLADGRDEVVYLVCSHPRVAFSAQHPDGAHPVLMASGQDGGGIVWDPSKVWARVTLPEHAAPSRIPWAVLDSALEWDEGLVAHEHDVASDPDGAEGRHRHELLAWIYDRHLELSTPSETPRGLVDGGFMDFRLEYVGSSGQEALRRPAGAHHKVPTILGRMLLYEPHRLVYLMACEIRIALFDGADQTAKVPMLRIGDAVATYRIDRSMLIAVAEEALIASSDTPYNKRNTVRRRFPATAAGEQLAKLGVRRVMLGFYGLPERVRLSGLTTFWERDTQVIPFDLSVSYTS